MNRNSLRFGALAMLSCGVVLALPGQDAQARRGPNLKLARAPLVLTSFVQDGRTDVARNEVLVFKFSALLKKNTVNNRTLQVNEITPTGLAPTIGGYKVKQTTVKYDPSLSQRTLDLQRKNRRAQLDDDNPEAFGSFANYEVEIPGPPTLRTIKNLRRNRILQAFFGEFRTNERYLDRHEGQPSFVGAAGELSFEPPASGATGLVDEDAVIVFEFSEPMDINSLDPASTVRVTRIRLGERVPGTVEKDPNEPSGKRFLFIPSFGFGSDELNQSGWDIEVELGNAATGEFPTDLAGNPLKRPKTFRPFRTRFVEGKQSASVLTESFDDDLNMDPETVTLGGEWNTIEEGALRGGAATAFPNQDFSLTTDNSSLPGLVRFLTGDPLVAEVQVGSSCLARPQGSRVQLLYVPGDVGEEGALTSIGWGPSSNALFAAFYSDITLKLGHSSVQGLTTDFDAAFNVGGVQTVYSGGYQVPQAKNINPSDPVDGNGVTDDPNATGFWPWPAFSSPFEWNGVNNLVFDMSCDFGDTCQILRATFVAAGGVLPPRQSINFSNKDADVASLTQPVTYDTRFQKRRRTTKALSSWLELATDTPQFSQPILSPVGQPGGVTVLVELEGAQGRSDPLNPGGFIPDPTTSTGWQTDPSEVNGNRFVRYRISMVANLVTGQTARVTSFQLPYIF